MTPTIQVERPAELPGGAAGAIHAALARLPGVVVEAVRMAPGGAAVVARTTATPAQLAEVVAAVAGGTEAEAVRGHRLRGLVRDGRRAIRQVPAKDRTPEQRMLLALSSLQLGDDGED